MVPWLHSVLCYYCAIANFLKLIRRQKGELVFISKGYYNWKIATDSRKGFAKHQRSHIIKWLLK